MAIDIERTIAEFPGLLQASGILVAGPSLSSLAGKSDAHRDQDESGGKIV
jgi:hypothetical protein